MAMLSNFVMRPSGPQPRSRRVVRNCCSRPRSTKSSQWTGPVGRHSFKNFATSMAICCAALSERLLPSSFCNQWVNVARSPLSTGNRGMVLVLPLAGGVAGVVEGLSHLGLRGFGSGAASTAGASRCFWRFLRDLFGAYNQLVALSPSDLFVIVLEMVPQLSLWGCLAALNWADALGALVTAGGLFGPGASLERTASSSSVSPDSSTISGPR